MSGVGSFSVSPEQVSGLSSQIRTGATGIRSELESLDSKVSQLRASWSGEAQASYDTAQRAWTQSLTELQQLLEQIAAKTDEIAQGYTAADKASAQRFAL
ncbi:WXG100 family type VII secretion target [Cellulomonas citrea]|uniref:WXG100 family type VII secretion target n=1 Tax=Cellulomonas citrea TaxID=1909423 RepID=UPI00135B6A0A|nr:WXG100 family type VII secretion target [Cellulomonas citrea]